MATPISKHIAVCRKGKLMFKQLKIKRALKGRKLNYVNAEKIANDLGYSIVFFNTPLGDIELERYNLLHRKSTHKAFTHSKTAKIIFLNSELSPDDRLYLLLHEIGHIVLGHVGDGRLMTRNQVLIEMEADKFAYSIIKGDKNKTPLILLISSIVLAIAIIFGVVYTNREDTSSEWNDYDEVFEDEYTVDNETSGTEEDTVYLTPSGEKYHRKTCTFIKKASRVKEMTRKRAELGHDPCSVCNP